MAVTGERSCQEEKEKEGLDRTLQEGRKESRGQAHFDISG